VPPPTITTFVSAGVNNISLSPKSFALLIKNPLTMNSLFQ
jgi:hypothetical protein